MRGWQVHRDRWFNALGGLLNIEVYLDRFFCTGTRLSQARTEVLAFQDGSDIPPTLSSIAAAEAWVRRVERWIDNLRNDLRVDSVAAPGDGTQRWLLSPSAGVSQTAGTGEILCDLCKRCREVFAAVDSRRNQPDPRMPDVARANGMWRGPDPKELADLTYCETKVNNLARVDVSVKRVFLGRNN